MPFGIGIVETSLLLVVMLLVYLLPLIAVIWTVLTLARLRRDQEAILARLATIERQLGGRA